MSLPAWLQSISRWPAWKLFLAALLVGLLLGVSWQCTKRGATDFFTATPAGPAVPAADTVPLPAVGAAPGQNGGVLDALPPRVAPPRPPPTPPSDTAADPGTDGNDPGAPHPMNGVAVAMSSPPPAYPADAMRMNEQGTVVLRVTVEPDGDTSDIAIEESSGSRSLDRAARQSLRRWRFQPAYRDGVAIRSEVRVPVRFALSK
jgi:periplasmic protein TonB